jgi:hypothetical protein
MRKKWWIVGVALLAVWIAGVFYVDATENPDYWNQFQIGNGDSLGFRAYEFGVHGVAPDTVWQYFEGSWTFWWDEGTSDILVVNAFDLYDSLGATGIFKAVQCSLRGGWSYGDFIIADSVYVQAKMVSDTVYIRAIGYHPEDTRDIHGGKWTDH